MSFNSNATKLLRLFFFSGCLVLGCELNSHAAESSAEPSMERGAAVFKQRCALCHGQQGLGEGLLPLKLKNYPNTNLLENIKAKNREDVHGVITLGPKHPNVSPFMPPMGDDLSWTELESVVDFIMYLRTNTSEAHSLIAQSSSSGGASFREGMNIFETRCALCHGKSGEGNGRMSKIIKSPPPFDLTASRLPDSYLFSIIKNGGESLSRSPQMPPWGDQLTPPQIESVMHFIKSLRD